MSGGGRLDGFLELPRGLEISGVGEHFSCCVRRPLNSIAEFDARKPPKLLSPGRGETPSVPRLHRRWPHGCSNHCAAER